jgi:17beta-estradiol 17-dehydrogenase / very-long-chain 3-oxoacyl-CoA reductase
MLCYAMLCYADVQAYVDNMSKSLDVECRPNGVAVQSHVPMYVVSKMSKIRSSSFTTPDPATWVAASMQQIGHDSVILPFWVHALYLGVVNLLPVYVSDRLILSLHQDLRKRWYKKQEKSTKQK